MFVGGGGDSFLFIHFEKKKKKKKKHPRSESNPGFQPVVLVFLYSIPGVFCLSGGGGKLPLHFLKNEKKRKKRPRSESNPAFQSAREMLARFSRGFIHAAGIPMRARPWLAWAS